LLSAAEAGPLDTSSRARVEVLRGISASAWGDIDEAALLLLSAAKRLYSVDVTLARDIHLSAMGPAVDCLNPRAAVSLDEVAKEARAAPPPPGPERPQDLLLDGLEAFTTDGPAAAAPILRRALQVFRRARLAPNEAIRWAGFQCAAAALLWDLESNAASAESQVHAARSLRRAQSVAPSTEYARAHQGLERRSCCRRDADRRGGVAC